MLAARHDDDDDDFLQDPREALVPEIVGLLRNTYTGCPKIDATY